MARGTETTRIAAEIALIGTRTDRIARYKTALSDLMRQQEQKKAIELARIVPYAGDQLVVCDLLITLFLDAQDFANAGEVVRLLKHPSRRVWGWIRIARASGSAWEQRDLKREVTRLDTTDHELVLAVYDVLRTDALATLIRAMAECETVDGDPDFAAHLFLRLATLTGEIHDFTSAWRATAKMKGWRQDTARQHFVQDMLRCLDHETVLHIVAETKKDRLFWETAVHLAANKRRGP
ncbi:hypothetical protein KBD18_01085 [Patescibacteria group bacterium]|nr:hypothetical protein [Patescibacteria group bacterium]